MWYLDTIGNPIPSVFAMASVTVVLMSWFLAAVLSKTGPTTRTIAIAVCFVIMSLVALSVGIAMAYPGPAGRYPTGTVLHWVHLHALQSGSYLALLLPLCVACLVAARRPQGGKRTTIVAVALSLLMIAPSLLIGLAVVCNHAGACP